MSVDGKTFPAQFEQLELPIVPPLLTWVIMDGESVPIITRQNVKDFSREHTGNTNLGTRVVNSIEAALGYNRYYDPDPRGHSIKDVLDVLREAKETPDARPFWWLGVASVQLFQEFCDGVEAELAKK